MTGTQTHAINIVHLTHLLKTDGVSHCFKGEEGGEGTKKPKGSSPSTTIQVVEGEREKNPNKHKQNKGKKIQWAIKPHNSTEQQSRRMLLAINC